MKSLTTSMTRLRMIALACVAAAGATACSDRPPAGVYSDPDPLLGSVHASAHAVNLVAGGTLQLTSNAFNLGGAPVTDLDSLTYTSSSTSRVTVSPTGLVTAIDVTEDPVIVLVTAAKNRVSQVDTVLVNVLPPVTAPPVRFAVGLYGDSLRIAVNNGNQVLGSLITAANDTIPNVLISVSTKDPNIASANRYVRDWYLNGYAPGKTTVYVSTTLSGVTYTDSLQVIVGWATDAYEGFNSGMWSTLYLQNVIQTGGAMHWYNYNSDLSPAVIFDDPSTALPDTVGAPSGNIDPFSGMSVARRFNAPGTYTWHSTLSDGTVQHGSIIVRTNPF